MMRAFISMMEMDCTRTQFLLVKATNTVVQARTSQDMDGTLKLSKNKKDLNDVTAAPFSVFFLLLAAVTSLRTFFP